MTNFLQPELDASTPLLAVEGPTDQVRLAIQKLVSQEYTEDFSIFEYCLGDGLSSLKDKQPVDTPDDKFADDPIGMLEWAKKHSEQVAAAVRKINNGKSDKDTMTTASKALLLFVFDYEYLKDNQSANSIIAKLTGPTGSFIPAGCTLILCGPQIVSDLSPTIKPQTATITLPLPTREELAIIVPRLYADADAQPPKPELVKRIVDESVGMTTSQFTNAAARSLALHGFIDPLEIRQHFKQKIDVPGTELLDPGPTLKDLAGYAFASQITLTLAKAFANPKANPKGILVYGPPGTGKSFLGQCAAGELGWKCLLVRISELKDKYVGESSRNLRKLFTLLEAAEPAIVVIDEIEKVFGSGDGTTDGGVTGDLLSSFLSWQQERKGKRILTIATCNQIHTLPPEFTRAGRFDFRLFMDVPQKATRKAIWKLYMEKLELPEQETPDDTDWTGAEIRACCETNLIMKNITGESLLITGTRIRPVTAQMGAQMMAFLRDRAANSCLDAETGMPYKYQPTNQNGDVPPPPPPDSAYALTGGRKIKKGNQN